MLKAAPSRTRSRKMKMIDLILLDGVDRMDFQLREMLRPIGSAIAASDENIGNIENQFSADIENEDDRQLIFEEADIIKQNLLGLAFVAGQAYITAVVSRLIKLSTHHNFAKSLKKDRQAGSVRSAMLRFGFCDDNTAFPRIEVLDAFANYYKHADEWDEKWKNLKNRQADTAKVIRFAGASPHNSVYANLSAGANFLDCVGDLSNLYPFEKVFSEWREGIVGAYKRAVGWR
jgi:hypothetical protein